MDDFVSGEGRYELTSFGLGVDGVAPSIRCVSGCGGESVRVSGVYSDVE